MHVTDSVYKVSFCSQCHMFGRYHFTRNLSQIFLQYIPRNMHTVFALLCFVVVIHWLIFPYPSGLLHWHCGNLTIAQVPAKQPWWIWIYTSCELIMNDCITATKQSTTNGVHISWDILYMHINVNSIRFALIERRREVHISLWSHLIGFTMVIQSVHDWNSLIQFCCENFFRSDLWRLGWFLNLLIWFLKRWTNN